MKILIVARPFVFHGGVERATDGFVRALVEHGHDVHLLTPPGQGPLPGVTLHRLPLPRLPSAARVLALALLARAFMARGTWDVTQSHERTLGQGVYRAGEGCHRAYLASVGGRRARGLFHRIVLALEARVLRTTPRIVAIARRGKAEIETLYGVPPSSVTVVYNGVDLTRFDPRHRARFAPAARAEAGVAADARVALFVGSGFERKGLATAIDAMAGTSRPLVLLVVGRGDRAPYEAQAGRLGLGGRLRWLGARPDVERWYAAADVVVLPTRYEPFGNVHLEALASGVPVVTSRVAGGAEVVTEGVTGAVVDPGDAEAVARALDRMAEAPRQAMEAAARAAAAPFTYAAQVAGFERVWRAGR